MNARSKPPSAGSTGTSRLPYVEETRARGNVFLYYRRRGRRIPLPQPEGSAAFLAAYDAAKRQMDGPQRVAGAGTANDAIAAYLGSVDYQQLRPATRSDYRRTLDQFRAEFGAELLAALDEAWVLTLREPYGGAAIAWNNLRSRMIEVPGFESKPYVL